MITDQQFIRMTKFKNVVMRRIIEIKELKAKPKLTDLQKQYIPKVDTSKMTEEEKELLEILKKKQREKLKKTLLALYDDQYFQNQNKDKKSKSQFDSIMKQLEDFKGKTMTQWSVIENLDKTMIQLKKRREEKDNKR